MYWPSEFMSSNSTDSTCQNDSFVRALKNSTSTTMAWRSASAAARLLHGSFSNQPSSAQRGHHSVALRSTFGEDAAMRTRAGNAPGPQLDAGNKASQVGQQPFAVRRG
jgi:hypothetical protein